MTAGIITLALQVGLRLVDWYLQKKAKDAAAIRAYLEFVAKIDPKRSARIRDSYQAQIERLENGSNDNGPNNL
jgi:hypothetical protein